MTLRRPLRLGLAVLVSVPLLAGCSDGWRTTLGLKQTAPDEFKVAAYEPLTMPPSLNELPAPKPGAGRPQATEPRAAAKQALFAAAGTGQGTQAASKSGGASSRGLSAGERNLLARANADAAPDDIRQIVTREAQQRAKELGGPLDDYLFWIDPPQPGEVVDPEAEAKRLRDNRAQGEPLTKGEVPIQEQEDRGLLGNL